MKGLFTQPAHAAPAAWLCAAGLAALLGACSAQITPPDTSQIQTPPHALDGASVLLAPAYERLGALHDDLIAFRRDIHRHPEIAGQEMRTSAKVSERLEQLGFQVRRNVGGHGVVAILQGGRPGGVVAFRADMDAMPSDAPDPVDFDSETPGIRHICGHDIHTTIGIALAEEFAAIQQDIPGTIVLIFQPAEETVAGARLMVEDGALENPHPDAIFAYHTTPYEVGQIAYSETGLMAARDRVTLAIPDTRRAGAMANALRERIAALGNVTSPNERQQIGSDFIDVAGAQVSRNEAGGWLVNANFSLATEAARQRLRGGIDQAIAEIAPAAGVVENYDARWAPGVTNDAELVRRAVASIRAALGDQALVQQRTMSPGFSEDFGLMQDRIPGAMFFLGVSNESRSWVGMPHSPNYVADEESIFVGARAMARIMLDSLMSNQDFAT